MYSIHIDMIQTEEVNEHAIISKNILKEKKFYISFKKFSIFQRPIFMGWHLILNIHLK